MSRKTKKKQFLLKFKKYTETYQQQVLYIDMTKIFYTYCVRDKLLLFVVFIAKLLKHNN